MIFWVPKLRYAISTPHAHASNTVSLLEASNVVLNDLLDLRLNVARNVARRDRLEELSLLAREVLTEVGLPLGDLVDGDRVEETVDTGVDDGDLNLHGQGLVLTLLCNWI